MTSSSPIAGRPGRWASPPPVWSLWFQGEEMKCPQVYGKRRGCCLRRSSPVFFPLRASGVFPFSPRLSARLLKALFFVLYPLGTPRNRLFLLFCFEDFFSFLRPDWGHPLLKFFQSPHSSTYPFSRSLYGVCLLVSTPFSLLPHVVSR